MMLGIAHTLTVVEVCLIGTIAMLILVLRSHVGLRRLVRLLIRSMTLTLAAISTRNLYLSFLLLHKVLLGWYIVWHIGCGYLEPNFALFRQALRLLMVLLWLTKDWLEIKPVLLTVCTKIRLCKFFDEMDLVYLHFWSCLTSDFFILALLNWFKNWSAA